MTKTWLQCFDESFKLVTNDELKLITRQKLIRGELECSMYEDIKSHLKNVKYEIWSNFEFVSRTEEL